MVLLIWRDSAHFDQRSDLPCVLCGRPTPLRSQHGEPVHKICAQARNDANPREVRFVSDAQPRRGDDVHA